PRFSPTFFSSSPPPTTEIYTLSLHDALPISRAVRAPATDRGHAHRSYAGGTSRGAGAIPSGAERRSVRPGEPAGHDRVPRLELTDRKSTRLNSSHVAISYAVFCLKKKKK